MAELAGLGLGTDDTNVYGGAVFRLGTSSRSMGPTRSANLLMDEDCEALVRDKVPYIVARLSKSVVTAMPAGTLDRAVLAAAHEVAQRALDILAMREEPQELAIANAFDRQWLWWRRGGRTTLLFVSRKDSTLIDQSGHPLIKAPPSWKEAFRYYRLSRTSADLFDSYRNMWLALESVLSTIQAQSPNETEDTWLRRSLGIVHADLNLNRYVIKQKPDPVQEFLDEQYRGLRNPLFHAKSHKGPTLPGSMARRETLVGALDRLQRLVDDAMRRYCASQRQTRVADTGPYHATIHHIAQKATLALFEDDVSADTSVDKLMRLPHVDMQTSFDRSRLNISPEQSIVGRIPAYPHRESTFRTLVLLTEGPVLTMDRLEDLSLQGIDDFEARMVFGVTGAGEPWTNFAL